MDDSSQRQAAPKGTILIVDDADTTMLEVSLSLIDGLLVESASSAHDALHALRSGDAPISAVVTDIHMPVMDGLQLIRMIREDTRHVHIPIIVVTADTDPDMPRRAQQAGADAFFSKPCSPAAVRKTLEELLNAKRES